jgi:hypothetical protein
MTLAGAKVGDSAGFGLAYAEVDLRVGLGVNCRLCRGFGGDRLGEGAGLVLVARAEYQVLPAADHRAAPRSQPPGQLDGLAMRRQFDAHLPPGLLPPAQSESIFRCGGLRRKGAESTGAP